MKPPTGGPSTGPSSAGTVSHAIAATSSCLRRGAQQHQPADRHHHGPADALQDARADQERQAVGPAAQDRSRW